MLLLEELIGDNYYLFSRYEIDELINKNNPYSFSRDGYKYSYFPIHKNFFNKYNDNIRAYANNPNYNYIYKATKNLNIFDLKKDLLTAVKNGALNIKRTEEYFDQKLTVNNYLQATKQIGLKYKWNDRDWENFIKTVMDVKFKNIYDGFVIGDDIEIFVDKFKKNSKLIGGNAIKFKISHDKIENNEIPDFVINELVRYSEDAHKRINGTIKKWLIDNFKKPYNEITVFRGFAVDFSDIDYKKNEIIKRLKRYTGLKLEDIKLNNPILVNRSKESSWSYNSEIADGFTTGFSSGSINFLVKATVPKNKVILDFTLLPDDIKKLFEYSNQNEVILDTGIIKSKIVKVEIDDEFSKWLKKNGYIFKNSSIEIK